jgi:hypothetical protein
MLIKSNVREFNFRPTTTRFNILFQVLWYSDRIKSNRELQTEAQYWKPWSNRMQAGICYYTPWHHKGLGENIPRMFKKITFMLYQSACCYSKHPMFAWTWTFTPRPLWSITNKKTLNPISIKIQLLQIVEFCVALKRGPNWYRLIPNTVYLMSAWWCFNEYHVICQNARRLS